MRGTTLNLIYYNPTHIILSLPPLKNIPHANMGFHMEINQKSPTQKNKPKNADIANPPEKKHGHNTFAKKRI